MHIKQGVSGTRGGNAISKCEQSESAKGRAKCATGGIVSLKLSEVRMNETKANKGVV